MVTITRAAERDWRAWRDIRLAALADAPDAFADTLAGAAALPEDDWREMTRTAAIFIAAAGPAPAGVVAGLPRESELERGLGAMWVAPAWRGRGTADALIGAVIGWAKSEGAARLGLWVPADNPRARACYQRQGFLATGRSHPFPGSSGRFIDEMRLDLNSTGNPAAGGAPRP